MRSVRVMGLLALFVFVGPAARAADNAPPSPTVADLWGQLATSDEGKATRAILALAKQPKEAVEFLGKTLKVVKVDKAKVAKWLEQLGDDTFTQREEAMRELALIAEFIKADLEKAAKSNDAEIRRRAALLLEKKPAEAKQPAKAAGLAGRRIEVQNVNGQITIMIDGKALDLNPRPPEIPKPNLALLQTTRCIALLEHLGTPEAKKILERLAEGVAESRQTKEAKAALKRLAAR